MSDATGIKDRYGLPMSTASPQAAELYWEGMDLLLAQDFGSEEKFQQAIEADEGFALAHAALSTMLILRARLAEAKESASTAVSLAAGITPRERQQVEAIRVYINGEGPRAISLIRQHLAEYPRDALMLKIAWRLLLLGCSGAGVQNYPQELLPLMRGLVSQYSDDDWAFLGQYSFAHHETGQMEEARRYGERSDELRPNAVAAHSVAHVYFETADHPGGREYLVDWMPVYDSRAPLLRPSLVAPGAVRVGHGPLSAGSGRLPLGNPALGDGEESDIAAR